MPISTLHRSRLPGALPKKHKIKRGKRLTPVYVRLPHDVHRLFERLAERDGDSVAGVARRVLVMYFEDWVDGLKRRGEWSEMPVPRLKQEI